MRMIILFMGALWQRGMSEEKLYYWLLVLREMLEHAKENRDMNASHALGGVGAETPATGIPADKQPAAHRRAHAGTHTRSIRHQGESGVFFHSICQLAALEVLCKHQLMKVKAHRESSSCKVGEEHSSLSTGKKQRG